MVLAGEGGERGSLHREDRVRTGFAKEELKDKFMSFGRPEVTSPSSPPLRLLVNAMKAGSIKGQITAY